MVNVKLVYQRLYDISKKFDLLNFKVTDMKALEQLTTDLIIESELDMIDNVWVSHFILKLWFPSLYSAMDHKFGSLSSWDLDLEVQTILKESDYRFCSGDLSEESSASDTENLLEADF